MLNNFIALILSDAVLHEPDPEMYVKCVCVCVFCESFGEANYHVESSFKQADSCKCWKQQYMILSLVLFCKH